MNMKEFCEHWGGSNGRKAMVLAMRALIENGDDILRAENRTDQRLRRLRDNAASAQELAEAQADLNHWREQRRQAENKIRQQFGLRLV